jgi:hypothetical protein
MFLFLINIWMYRVSVVLQLYNYNYVVF